jgi:universal stress protein E
VLAAIDIRAERESHEKLNEHIIDLSRRIMDSRSAEVHFINAFRNLQSFPDRNALIKSCGVNSGHVHIIMGEPEDVIVQGAHNLNASLVVVGNSARSGLSAVIDGNTVERVLDKLNCDVLSMP